MDQQTDRLRGLDPRDTQPQDTQAQKMQTTADPVWHRSSVLHDRGAHACLEWPGPGAGAPALHFAHATGFNASTYKRLLAPLACDMRIVACDQRGHGRTTVLPADPASLRSWLVYRDDLIALLEALAMGPAILSGHSMGATVSILTAIARPDLVKALVLLDPVLIPRHALILHGLIRGVGLTPKAPDIALGAEKRRAVFTDREAMVDRYTGRGAFTTWPREVVADYVEDGAQERGDGQVELSCAPAWEGATFRASSGHDYWGKLGQITCPVTLLRGTIGSTCAQREAAAFVSRVPQTDDRCIEGASHFLPMEHPERVREAIRAAVQ